MSPRVEQLISFFESWAPKQLAEEWDNVGLEIGEPKKEIKTILLSLDVDDDVLDYIQKHDVDIVVTHHPIFYKPIKSVHFNTVMGRILKTFIQTETALFTMHTNLDRAADGVSHALLAQYGFNPQDAKPLKDGFGLLLDMASPVEPTLFHKTLNGRFSGAEKRPVNRLAVLGGSGRSFIHAAHQKNVDLFITGEIPYHDELWCKMAGLPLLLLGHKESEDVVLPIIKEKLKTAFQDVDVEILL